MIILNKLTKIKGVSIDDFYHLSVELNDREIPFDATVNKKNHNTVDIICHKYALTEVLTVLAKIKVNKKNLRKESF